MKIIKAGTDEWRRLQAQDRTLGDQRLLCPAFFGPTMFVRESGDPPYLNAAAISAEGWTTVCQSGGTLPLHTPDTAHAALAQRFDPRLALSEFLRTGRPQEAGKVTEVRIEVRDWFFDLLKTKKQRQDFAVVFWESASLIEGTLRSATARRTAHRLLDELGD